jgi:hypothetical protein
MPKPRTNLTGIKHFGTILSHPQQYYRYRKNKDAFVQHDHLALDADYQAELGPGHPYPHAVGGTIRETGVIYPPLGGNPPETLVTGPISTHPVYDHQIEEGVAPHLVGEDKDTLVVLRQEQGATTLRAARKRGAHTDGSLPNVGRTQHSTLTGGGNVAGAAIYENTNTLVIASGHYGPGRQAATKLAIYGKQSGTIDRRATDFQDHNRGAVNVTLKQRMRIVSDWARTGVDEP